MGALDELLPGLWRWMAPHPEWRPHREFGREVASYALEHDESLVLIDPLIPSRPPEAEAEVWDALDRLAGERRSVAAMITIPYHVRSAAAIHARFGPDNVTVWGHPAVSRRVGESFPLARIEPGKELDAGASAHSIGRPRRYEMPLLLASHRALAFGDAVVGVHGGLRVWHDLGGERSQRWYRDRFLPTLAPLLDLDFDHVLPTHGDPVLEDGREQLEAALAAEPCDYGH